MSLQVSLATVLRVLAQLRHDRRTVALMLAFPTILMTILRFVFDSEQVFRGIAPALLGIFPFTVMFLVTSVATLRERRGGTLERLMTMPMGRGDFLLGYGVAFSLLAVVQVAILSAVTLTWLGLDVAGPTWVLVLVAVLDALLGTALGLGVSAFAATEFQAVQFLPVVVLPQVLLCGLFIDRDRMTPALEGISNVLPLTYAVDAMQIVTRESTTSASLWTDVAVALGFSLLALMLGSFTLRRQTP